MNAIIYNGLTLNVSNLPVDDYVSFIINGASELPAFFIVWPLLGFIGRRYASYRYGTRRNDKIDWKGAGFSFSFTQGTMTLGVMSANWESILRMVQLFFLPDGRLLRACSSVASAAYRQCSLRRRRVSELWSLVYDLFGIWSLVLDLKENTFSYDPLVHIERLC